MGRLKTVVGVAMATLAIALCGCSSMGLTLDQQVRVASGDASGYAKLDYPSQWHFMGFDGENQTDNPTEKETFVSVLVSPQEITANATPDDVTAQVIASCAQNTIGIHPDSSDDAINEYIDSMIKSSFPDVTIEDTTIRRDGDATTVEFTYSAPYESKTLSSQNKYILIGDYLFTISGASVSDADESTLATVKAIVDDFGYVANSAS